MGQAKQRGTFEERRANPLGRNFPNYHGRYFSRAGGPVEYTDGYQMTPKGIRRTVKKVNKLTLQKR